MKKILLLALIILTNTTFAAIPTDEGLLRNPNNQAISGQQVTLKAEVRKQLEGGAGERVDHYKFVFTIDDKISLLQVNYSNAQMLGSQIQDVKYIYDLEDAIRKDRTPERGMFYGALAMLGTNKAEPIEAFIERTGSSIIKNRALMNEDKMKLIRTYRNYLLTTKGKGEATSPLNPQDPAEKAKVVEIFKSNTFTRSKNIELIKDGNEFLWKADWKSVVGYFSNEERRLKSIEYSDVVAKVKLDASEYAMLNNANEFPRSIFLKDSSGETYKMSFYYQEVKKTPEKKLTERFEEAKKLMTKPLDQKEIFHFVF
jgi:hypothetical protein